MVYLVLSVESHISDLFTNNRDDPDSINVTCPPVDDDICCNQYRVVTSNGTTANVSATSFILYNITTQEERENASISVCCMDQIGTMGPEVVYRSTIGTLNC